MKFKRNVWFRGVERYLPQGGTVRDTVCHKQVEFDLEPGTLNKPILTLEIDGAVRYFVFDGETTSWHYSEVPAPISLKLEELGEPKRWSPFG